MYEARSIAPLSRARFARRFARHAGIAFLLVVAGLLLAPLVHRILHRFHWEQNR